MISAASTPGAAEKQSAINQHKCCTVTQAVFCITNFKLFKKRQVQDGGHREIMNYSCILCDFVLVESKYRYPVGRRSSLNILDAIKSLPFNGNVNGQSYVCRTCFA